MLDGQQLRGTDETTWVMLKQQLLLLGIVDTDTSVVVIDARCQHHVLVRDIADIRVHLA